MFEMFDFDDLPDSIPAVTIAVSDAESRLQVVAPSGEEDQQGAPLLTQADTIEKRPEICVHRESETDDAVVQVSALTEESHASPSLAPERLLSTLEQLVSQNDVAGCSEQCRRWRSGVQYDPSDRSALFALNESGSKNASMSHQGARDFTEVQNPAKSACLHELDAGLHFESAAEPSFPYSRDDDQRKSATRLSTTSEHATSSFSNGEIARMSVAFFGICDLKYDGQKKKGSQVKVLELGNGFASKFSGYGGHILENFSRKYEIVNKLDRDMLVNNKKLTHDVLFDAGYGDLLPQQASFNRSYTPDLHERIARELDLRNDGEETVVLKLLNRCRGAGVVVTRIGSALDQMLHRLLNPPKAWTDASPEVELDAALAVDPDVENCRHWWANESPIFLAERCETSCQLKKEAGLFDPTMRIGFVVIRTGEPEAPFRIKFLGGYWKLPAAPVSSADVHTRCVSKAASKGTAEVVPEDLKMVYCQLRIPLADAFGVDIRLELPLFSLRYEQTFCSFLQMSSAMARMKKDNGRIEKTCLALEREARIFERCLALVKHGNIGKQTQFVDGDNGKKLQFPSKVTKKLLESPAHGFKLNHRNMSCMAAASHVERQLGCKAAMLGDWIGAAQRWTRSLEMYGWNASSEHLLGLHSLRSKEYQTAERHLRTSLAMDPDFKATYANLSAAYLGLDSYESAEKVAKEGLRRWPDFPECSYNLGVAITMSLANEIGAPIGNRQKELRARSRNAVRLLREARDSTTWEKGKTESTCSWMFSDDNYLSFLQELARHLDCDGSELVYTGCEKFSMKSREAWIICNFRP